MAALLSYREPHITALMFPYLGSHIMQVMGGGKTDWQEARPAGYTRTTKEHLRAVPDALRFF